MKTLKIYLLVFIILCFSGSKTHAQIELSGNVKTKNNQPALFANVLLLQAADSSLVQGTVTDEKGFWELTTKPGKWIINVSMIGYSPVSSDILNIGNDHQTLSLDNLVLHEDVLELDEVAVTATKPLYELKQDRMVMNIDALPSMSGNTGLELMQKIPGVIVDRQNNSIGMNAKGEVLVMINDKVQRIPAEVLMTRLQGMRAENIEQIEIIDQPPAKYDASGAAGIINIVLKKNDQGTNGSMTLTGGYGQREKAGLSLNLNSRKGKFNWYGDYNFNRNRSDKYEINHFREYDYQGDHYYYENFVTLHNYEDNQHAANLGIDVDFDGRTVIGFLLGGAMAKQVWGSGADSRSFDFVNDELIGEASYLFGSNTDMSSFSANANMLQKIGSDSHLNFNLDYAKIRYGNSGNLRNNDDPGHAITYERDTPMEFWILSLDNVNRLGDVWIMETGVKGTLNSTLNTTSFNSFNDENWSEPDLFSREGKIREQILATYLSFKGELSEKLNAELGIRHEHYTYRLIGEEQEDIENIFSRPFPVIRLNYEIDSVNTVQLGFNRSITRPSFFHLTSFLALFDPSLIVYANPRLQPTFTNTFKISWQRNSVTLYLAYLNRQNQIYFYNTVDKENHLQTSVPTNLDQESIIEANLSFPLSPARWLEMNWNLNAYYHYVKDESSRPSVFEKDIFNYTLQLNSTFLLGNDWSIGMDGMYMSPFLVGDQRQFRYPYLNLGLRKKFPSGSSLSITLQDITNSMGKEEWEYHQPELGIRTFGNNDFSERQVRVTYTLLFGNQKLSSKRQRKTGVEEVKSRME